VLLVSTKLGVSLLEGIGLFAVEPIAAGTVIWRLHPTIDLRLTEEQIAELASPCREQARKYSYREKHSGLYVLCGDDARFFNHSASPNCLDIYNDPDADLTVAARDIKAGEELTCNYALFDLDLIEGKYNI
jgi:SET domain-containing protein